MSKTAVISASLRTELHSARRPTRDLNTKLPELLRRSPPISEA